MRISGASTRQAEADLRAAVLTEARQWRDTEVPWGDDFVLEKFVLEGRRLVRLLVHLAEQDQAETNRHGIAEARKALTGPRAERPCRGSGWAIEADRTDGNGLATCPVCHRYRPTRPIGDNRIRLFEPHGGGYAYAPAEATSR